LTLTQLVSLEVFLEHFLFVADALLAPIDRPGVNGFQALPTLGLEHGVSQVKRLVEPLKVQDPGDSLTQDPEVVAEK